MLYFYAHSQGQAAGPIELLALHAGLMDGNLTPETPAVEEGGTDWKPLSALLRYFYATGGEVLGPVRLAELKALTASGDSDLMFMPEGGTEWLNPAAILRRPNPPMLTARLVHVAAFVPGPVMRATPQKLPAAAATAGWLWISYSVLLLVDVALAVPETIALPREVWGYGIGALFFRVLVAGAFLFVGTQTRSGKARDTRGNGIGSIGLGALALIFLFLFPERTAEGGLIAVLFQAAMLITAGILALHARKAYRAWKRSPSSLRRR